MKLDDLQLNEGMFRRKVKPRPSHARGADPEVTHQRNQGHKWRGTLKFEKQAQIFKRFLRQFPINELASIYGNAVNAGRFSSEELSTVRKAMMQRRWPEEEVRAMAV